MTNSSNMLSISLAVVIVAGCSTLVDQESIKIEIDQDESVLITHWTATSDQDNVIIRGNVQFPHWDDYGYHSGHVDAIVKSPTGENVKLRSAELLRELRRKVSGQEAEFDIQMPLNLPKGTVVQLKYHNTNKIQNDRIKQ